MNDRSSIPSPAEIADRRLPESARELVETYNRRIDRRPDYLWKWLYEVLPRYRLSTVPERFHETVREQKLLLTIFYTLLDDLADCYGDRATFAEARKLPIRHATPTYDRGDVDGEYLAITEAAWRSVEDTLRAAPRTDEFWPVFEFDCEQALNAMHYSYLVNEMPALATETGTDAYAEHNMAQFSYADVDILFSPSFATGDLRELREVVWSAQRLARISNWIATWERELDECDLTSGVVVRALANDVLTVDELTDSDVPVEALVERVRDCGLEREYRDEWDRLFERLTSRSYDAESVDLEDYLGSMREMRDLYLDSRGRI